MSRTLNAALLLAIAVCGGGGAAVVRAQSPPKPSPAGEVVVVPSPAPQYVSPAGKQYFVAPDTRSWVSSAQIRASEMPRRADSLAKLGDAFGAIFDHRAAIEAYTLAIAIEPEDPSIFQRRGHRYLSNREFDKAAADLERSTRLDPTLPSAWYYLGFTHYLAGRFERAAECYEQMLTLSMSSADLATALPALDWLYLSYKRAKLDDKAAAVLARVPADAAVGGNVRLYLQRMLFYKGLRTEAEMLDAAEDDTDRATSAYGIGSFYLASGKIEDAKRLFSAVVATTAWPSLAFIAAEVELAR